MIATSALITKICTSNQLRIIQTSHGLLLFHVFARMAWLFFGFKKSNGSCALFVHGQLWFCVQRRRIELGSIFSRNRQQILESGKLTHEVNFVDFNLDHTTLIKSNFFQAGYPSIGFSPMRNTPVVLHDHNEFLNEKVFSEVIDAYCKIIPALANVPPFTD